VTFQRRRFLGGAAAALGGAAVAGGTTAVVLRPDHAASATAPAADRGVAFHGAHQAGVITDRQAQSAFVSFDLTAVTRTEFEDVLRSLTARARFLTAGGTPPNLGISAPPSDSGMLGPVVTTAGLTITVGLGASAFDDRFGLEAARPRRLRRMDTFPNDDLDPARSDGDLLVQICADDQDVVLHALRDLTRHTRGGLQPRWRLNGFLGAPRPTGAPRNLLGFKDGTARPATSDPAEMNRLVWVRPGSGEPTWATWGSYQVVRIIRMLTEFWDRVTISEQERMIGRRRDTGAPLSGSVEADVPDYTDDPKGSSIPLDAHIRMANPRMAATSDQQLLRRGYSYDAGLDSNGNLDMGLIFSCFQQDLDRQFVTVQKRLADEPLTDYISPVGGGYFFTLPGVRDSSDWYGRELVG